MVSRKQISVALDPEMRTVPGLSPVNSWIIGLICVSMVTGILQTEASLHDRYVSIFAATNALLFAVFLVEYMLRLYAAPENPRYGSPVRYALTFASIIDLLVLLSFLLPFFGIETALLRLFRIARIIRLARLGHYSIAIQQITKSVADRRHELIVALVIGLSLMLLSATALHLAEKETQPEAFGSIPRALWWAVATLTTVGYGDVVPVTALGRIFASLTALTGVGLVALPTGILAAAFGEGIREAHHVRHGPPHPHPHKKSD